MKLRYISKDNNALSGVIEALLLVALVAIILSVIQLSYIPVIMEDKEAEHMKEISNQFSQLKSVIDIQSMMGILEEDNPISYTPITTSITLGNKKLPYFVTVGSSGEIIIKDKDSTTNKITFTPGGIPDYNAEVPLTSIIYHGYNNYYLDQSFILEGGGLILNQADGMAMRINPSINVQNYSALGYIKVNFTLQVYKGITGRLQDAGSEQEFIRTNYSKHITHLEPATTSIKIYSDYLNAWNQSLKKDDTGLFWEYVNNGYIAVDYDNPSSPTYIEISKVTKDIYLELAIIEICSQVGPGYVIE